MNRKNEKSKFRIWQAWAAVIAILLVTELIAAGIEHAGLIKGQGQAAYEGLTSQAAEETPQAKGTESGQPQADSEDPQRQAAQDPPQAKGGKDAPQTKTDRKDSEEQAARGSMQSTAKNESAQSQGVQESQKSVEEESGSRTSAAASLSHEGYTLNKVVILSRHNIRSPLSGSGSTLQTMTPHEWHAWSSSPSELSLRGGVLETEMGQYFRKWFEAEGFFPENYHPGEEEVRIYANSKQRTMATAKYFTAGLLPTADTWTETQVEYDQMDPVFTPQFVFMNDAYAKAVTDQVLTLYSEKLAGLSDNCDLLARVLDLEDSEAFRSGEVPGFRTDDTALELKADAEPRMTSSLKNACSASDALVLQYYEEPDLDKASFGEGLNHEEWEKISEIKDVYIDTLFTAPLAAPHLANPLLEEIQSELEDPGRRFTFLCGHDSNIASVTAALGVEDYQLPDAIEKRTPIGCKIVFSEWRDMDDSSWMSVDLVYQTDEQLRGCPLLDLENPPAVYPLTLEGLERNADGLYGTDAVMERLYDAIGEFDRIMQEYAPDVWQQLELEDEAA